jgi:hypothetical protein
LPPDGPTLLERARRFLHRRTETPVTFSRPLVLLQSDAWGRVGVRDREGYEETRARGLRLGEHPYDLYSLETAEDIEAIASLLKLHRDSAGRHPALGMNFCVANLDFSSMRKGGFQEIKLLPLARGFPGRWRRPGLLEAYRSGIDQALFHPSLHGLTHFCHDAVAAAILENGQQARSLRLLWEADTPYIFWRMPWIGYEYAKPERAGERFLSLDRQRVLIQEAVQMFTDFFGMPPASACAPGYRSNCDTHRAWAECGIRIVQNGIGRGLCAPQIDEFGLLHVHRVIDFEPSQREIDLEKYLQVASACAAQGVPIIISVHSINFHSSLKDFRGPALNSLGSLLGALESRYPDLLYVSDSDLYEIATTGECRRSGNKISVGVRSGKLRARAAGGNA